MSVEEAQNYFLNVIKTVPIMKSLGVTMEYNEDGEAVFRMPRNPNFDHGMKDTHGGIFATLLDSAGWFTVAAKYQKIVVTSDLHVRMLDGAKHRDLVATGKLVRGGAKTAVAEMKLCSADGELIAIATGAFTFVSDIPQRKAD